MVYAGSDIHGCYDTLKLLFNQLEEISMYNTYYFLGDYIDRGPDSKKVLDFLIELRQKNENVVILRGNHEQMMLNTYNNCTPKNYLLWEQNGCISTLLNFNINTNKLDNLKKIPIKYIDFINSLPFFAETDRFLMAHAGFNFKCENPFSDTESMLWIRTDNYDLVLSKGKTIVHGHTILPLNQITKKIKSNSKVISIDSGCFFNKLPELGWLSALNLSTLELISVKNIEN